jgi:lipoprotein-anchoring transpeptidase ErfK/SrfK
MMQLRYLSVVTSVIVAMGMSASSYSNTFVFNPRAHTWSAIDNSGNVVRTGRASGGSSYCKDIHRSCRTPTGTFSVWSKGSASCKSSRYPRPHGGAPMPYCMFFSKYYAIHGSYDVPNYNASHGCVRVTPSDAAWLSKNFIHIGTTVKVKSY